MKKVQPARLLIFLLMMAIAAQVSAQHFISIQAGDKQPFNLQLNGTSLNSSKTGTLRVANLVSGSYSMAITPAGKKYPPQKFMCVIDDADLSYTLMNDAKKGWLLRNNKSNEVLLATAIAPGAAATGDINSPFALMLAQAVNDPTLLKPTPWVLTNKIEGAETAALDGEETHPQVLDTSAYVPETKGIIKAMELEVNGGTEITFVDFNKAGGDTIRIVIPSTEDEGSKPQSNPPAAVKNEAQPKTDAVNQNTTVVATPPGNTATKPDSAVTEKKKDDVAPAFDTSANKQMVNPFFDKKPAAQPSSPVDTANPVAQHQAASVQKTEDNSVAQNDASAARQPAVAVNNNRPAVKSDCKKMLSSSDEEKLRHRVYLETDDDKMVALTKKALDGKCITTAQVKGLLSFFLSDDTRYKFLLTVYPFVYDTGNFGGLETYMIDRKYKDMFEAMIK